MARRISIDEGEVRPVIVRGPAFWTSLRARSGLGQRDHNGLGLWQNILGFALPLTFFLTAVSGTLLSHWFPDTGRPVLSPIVGLCLSALMLVFTLGLTEQVEIPEGSVLDSLNRLLGDSRTPVPQRSPSSRWALRALIRIPKLEDAQALPELPRLVRVSGEVDFYARRLSMPTATAGLERVWDLLDWRPDSVAFAADRLAKLAREMKALEHTQAKLLARVDAPVTKARADARRRHHQERVDDQLAAAFENVHDELAVNQGLLDDPNSP